MKTLHFMYRSEKAREGFLCFSDCFPNFSTYLVKNYKVSVVSQGKVKARCTPMFPKSLRNE